MRHVDLTWNFLGSVKDIGRDAVSAILEVMRDGSTSERSVLTSKRDKSLVTQTVFGVHNIIIQKLNILTPGILVVSEEDETSWNKRSSCGYFWLVGPLGDTRVVLRQNGEITVNIALIAVGCVKTLDRASLQYGKPGILNPGFIASLVSVKKKWKH